MVIQAVKPWMSERDIEKGQAWFNKLIKALVSVKQGIICLTPESLSEPWVLFETGIIFKGLDESRVWTYLMKASGLSMQLLHCPDLVQL